MRRFIAALDWALDTSLLVLFILLFLIGGYTMYDSWLVYTHAQDTSILKYKPKTGAGDEDFAPISEDAVAWLTIDDTKIDYPVMQGIDNNEYLNKDPYGNYSLAGSIFLDSRNARDFSDPYSLVYGHHMEHGAMFGALDEFLERSYFEEHRNGMLMVTNGKSYRIELFACVEADGAVGEIFAPNETGGPLNYVREHAAIWHEPEDGQLIALSTCKFPETSERIIVFGVLYEDELE